MEDILMKRFVVPFLAVLAVFGLSPALASASTVKLRTIPVDWRQQSTALGPMLMADSIAMRTPRSATVNDTSSAIDIRQFVLPLEAADGGSAVDSVSFLRVDIFPTLASPAVTADTAFIAIQVSNDGVAGWVTCTGTSDFLGASDTPAPDTPAGRVLEQGSTNAFYITISQISQLGKLFVGNRSSSTAPTWQQLYGWPYIRLIVQGDMAGRYDAKVTGFVPYTAVDN